MDAQTHIRQLERQDIRWRLLEALYAARPIGTNQRILRMVVSESATPVTDAAVEAELEYLEGRDLVAKDRGRHYEITSAGVDVVEGTVDPPPGVARIDG